MVDSLSPVYALVGSMGQPALNSMFNFQGAYVYILLLTTARQIARIAFASALDLDYDLSSANDVISILTSSLRPTVSTSAV